MRLNLNYYFDGVIIFAQIMTSPLIAHYIEYHCGIFLLNNEETWRISMAYIIYRVGYTIYGNTGI